MESTLAKVNTPEPFNQDLMARFVAYCDVKQNTIDGYAVALRHFAKWMEGRPEPQREDIRAYKEYLSSATSEAGKPFKPATQARYLRAVKLFFKWTAAEGLYLGRTGIHQYRRSVVEALSAARTAGRGRKLVAGQQG